MRIFLAADFEKSYRKLPRHIQLLAQKKEKIFRKNPYAPSLKTHKLHGKLEGFVSFSVNHSYRIIFRFVDDDVVIFYDIGTHSIYS